MNKLIIYCIIVIGRKRKPQHRERLAMNITIIILSTILGISVLLNLASISTAIFLGWEMIKKFSIIWQFTYETNQLREYTHIGTKDPRMQNIMIASKHGHPFTAVVGLKLKLPPFWTKIGFDPFLIVKSDDHGTAVFRTFLGTEPCQLLIIASGLDQTEIIVITGDRADLAIPTATAKRHWFQR